MKDFWDNSDLVKKEARFSFKEIMIIIVFLDYGHLQCYI